MSLLEEKLEFILSRIAAAHQRAGRTDNLPRLVAVSKKQPAELIREAWDAGQTIFGESRVQEAQAKIPQLPSGIEWHFIGHLQSNKVRKALPLFSLFHSVDSLDLARDIDRIAAELGLFPKVLLEINVSGESTKFGFRPEQLERDLEDLLGLNRLEILGLMTMAPFSEDPETARPVFASLHKLREKIQDNHRLNLPELSMGMSGDFEVAIEEGATLVRVGTAIFGER